MSTKHHLWVPACGGTEKPFTYKGFNILYMWCPATGEHKYYDIRADIFYDLLSDMSPDTKEN